MKLIEKAVLAFAVSAAVAADAANTWYVDDDNFGRSGLTGKSGELAFGTIQDAIAQASSGDTIYVAPGEYKEGTGGNTSSYGLSRIGWNNKKLFIFSTGGAAETHIVGRKSAENGIGTGADAVRCVTIYDPNRTAAGTVIKGFTFRDGSTTTGSHSVNTFALRGGAVSVSHAEIYFADCVFRNCSAPSGSAVFNGSYVRCLFSGNVCDSADASVVGTYTGGSTLVIAQLYACVFHHNTWGLDNAASGGKMFQNVLAVNCTVIDNSFKVCGDSANNRFYNTVFFHSGTHGKSAAWSNCMTETDEPRPVMSTLVPDVRLLPQSKAIGAGDASHLSLVSFPDAIGLSDFGGNVLAADSGRISAGATQTVGRPAAGGIAVKSGVTVVDGGGRIRSGSYSYVFPDAYPTQYLFSAVAPEGKRLMYFKFEGNPLVQYDIRYPDRSDRLQVMPPADPDTVITNTDAAVRDVVYVKPDADVSVADGSEERPYRTLQSAYNAHSSSVIVAKAGTYAEGVTNDTVYGRSRLQISTSVRITSEEGAEKTVILGESDAGPDADQYGRGPDAVRCIVGYNSLAQIQGFTLAGGRTTADSDSNKSVGAAVRSTNANPYFYLDDCIVSNNVSKTSGVCVNARMSRCLVAENPGCAFLAVGGACCGSVFKVSRTDAPSSGVFGNNTRVVNCTVAADGSVMPYDTSSEKIYRYASIFSGGDTLGGNGVSAGNVCWGFASVADAAALPADPLLADPSGGDFHPFAASPVFAAGVVPEASNYGGEYWYYATTDYENNPISFVGGKPVAGAFMKPTDRCIVAVSAPDGGISPASDRIEVEEGDECVLSVGSATRPVAAICVNGVTNAVDSAGWTFSIPAEAAKGGVAVGVLYTNVWYAASDGDDSKSGMFPDAAKTLKGALSNANLLPGDRVVALPGTYNSGEMIQEGGFDIPSRAVVPAEVSLESLAGPAETSIVGKQASSKDAPPGTPADVRGLGADAVRCVYLSSGASVRGFTLTNGWTRAALDGTTVSYSDPDTSGGGVWCADIGCRIENCVLTGNGAYRGGGVFRGFCRNSVFAGNFAYYGGGASSDSRNHGCLSYGNEAAVWSVNAGMLYVRDAINCSCFDSLSQGYSSSSVVSNTVVAGTFNPNNILAGGFSHCVFNSERLLNLPDGFFEAAHSCKAEDSENLAFDGYRPVIGRNACVDAGTGDVLEALGDCDLFGGQRVYNGRIDVGALEADWRGRYASDISKRMAVVSASPAVVERPDASVRLPEGASLEGVLAKRAERRYIVVLRFRVSGGGSAKLTLNGEELTLGEGDTDIRTVVGDGDLAVKLVALSGTADILKAHMLAGTVVSVR